MNISNIILLTYYTYCLSLALFIRRFLHGGVDLLLSPCMAGLENRVGLALSLSRLFAGIPISSR